MKILKCDFNLQSVLVVKQLDIAEYTISPTQQNVSDTGLVSTHISTGGPAHGECAPTHWGGGMCNPHWWGLHINMCVHLQWD